jgi:DNA-binding response OmpR family regulator
MTRVLVVEDQRAFAAQLKHELGALGWSVSLVTTAEDCFRAAASEPPSVVLVSADLAPVSGINLCNGLKRDPKLRHVPLVIMATKPDASLESHRKLPTRADHYVRKSEDARELAERLKQLFAAEQPAVSQPPASHASRRARRAARRRAPWGHPTPRGP